MQFSLVFSHVTSPLQRGGGASRQATGSFTSHSRSCIADGTGEKRAGGIEPANPPHV